MAIIAWSGITVSGIVNWIWFCVNDLGWTAVIAVCTGASIDSGTCIVGNFNVTVVIIMLCH